MAARRMFYLYASFYCVGCSFTTSATWWVPRKLGLSVYTLWSTLGLLPMINFGVGEGRVWEVAAWTLVYGFVMTGAEDMRGQNLGIAAVGVGSVLQGFMTGRGGKDGGKEGGWKIAEYWVKVRLDEQRSNEL